MDKNELYDKIKERLYAQFQVNPPIYNLTK
jgi:hypothetical protein